MTHFPISQCLKGELWNLLPYWWLTAQQQQRQQQDKVNFNQTPVASKKASRIGREIFVVTVAADADVADDVVADVVVADVVVADVVEQPADKVHLWWPLQLHRRVSQYKCILRRNFLLRKSTFFIFVHFCTSVHFTFSKLRWWAKSSSSSWDVGPNSRLVNCIKVLKRPTWL